jgi:hypothetical protein
MYKLLNCKMFLTHWYACSGNLKVIFPIAITVSQE